MKYSVIIGGPGGSGSSTIAKRIAEAFNLKYIYAGQIIRDIAKREGFDSCVDFLKSIDNSKAKEFDVETDKKLLSYLDIGNYLIDSKLISALADKQKYPNLIKIWITSDISIRTRRALISRENYSQEKAMNANESDPLFVKYMSDLKQRFELDKNRYFEIYSIEYNHPEKYYDLIHDSSNETLEETYSKIYDFVKKKKESFEIDVINDPLLTEKTFNDDLYLTWNRKKCLNCNLLIEKQEKITICPRCKNDDPKKLLDID